LATGTEGERKEDLMQALTLVNAFKGSRLSNNIAQLEYSTEGRKPAELARLLETKNINGNLLHAAVAVKRAAAQIDEVVHAVGTLLCMTEILDDDEVIEGVSLAAGNTGRSFDLETSKRVAEFTFIEWKGGSESIRKQKILKDFYVLAESLTPKSRYLYVVGDEHGPRVFLSRSPCKGMLRKFAALQTEFVQKYGPTITVREYYQKKKQLVQVVDLHRVAYTTAKMLV